MSNLNRFVTVQDGVYETALCEMQKGRKQSHWMWFVFPQVKGLGMSYESQYYGIDSLYEARQYLEYDELGNRLREITREVIRHSENGIEYVMGGSDVDALKFRSSMTLFDIVSPNECFERALNTFFNGEQDPKTLAIVREEQSYLFSPSAFIRYNVGNYQDKGFFESGSSEYYDIPRERLLPTLVDLCMKGECMRDMVKHYLFHRDFSPVRLSGVESTIESHCFELISSIASRGDQNQLKELAPIKGWRDKISDVDTAAETFDWILVLLRKRFEPQLKELSSASLVRQ